MTCDTPSRLYNFTHILPYDLRQHLLSFVFIPSLFRHRYGTMDSLNKVFQRAVTESRGKYIHLNLAEQYEKAKDFAGAATIFEKALKKHKKSKKVWMCCQQSTT